MKNHEKYLDEIIDALFHSRGCCNLAKQYVIKEKTCLMLKIDCKECQRLTREWLFSECEE